MDVIESDASENDELSISNAGGFKSPPPPPPPRLAGTAAAAAAPAGAQHPHQHQSVPHEATTAVKKQSEVIPSLRSNYFVPKVRYGYVP